MFPLAIKTNVYEQAGRFCCQLDIPLRSGGYLNVLAVVDSAEILAALKRAGLRLVRKAGKVHAVALRASNAAGVAGVDLGEVGGFFSSIGKLVKKIGRSKVLRKALSIGKGIISSPIVKAIVPQAAAAIAAAEGAAKLVRAATSRSSSPGTKRRARMAILAARAQAKREKQAKRSLPMPRSVQQASPAARGTFRYLVQVAHAA